MPNISTVFVIQKLDATGIFQKRLDIGFVPKKVVVKQIACEGDHGLAVIRTSFVQGGILGVFDSPANEGFDTKFKVSSMAPSSTYEFRLVDGDGVLKTNMNDSSLSICLEFHD